MTLLMTNYLIMSLIMTLLMLRTVHYAYDRVRNGTILRYRDIQYDKKVMLLILRIHCYNYVNNDVNQLIS